MGERDLPEATNPLKFTGDMMAAAKADALKKATQNNPEIKAEARSDELTQPNELVEQVKQQMSWPSRLRNGFGGILKYVGWQI